MNLHICSRLSGILGGQVSPICAYAMDAVGNTGMHFTSGKNGEFVLSVFQL